MSASYKFALEAQKHLGSGNAAEAVRMLEEGLQTYPEYATAYTLLARAYMNVNDNTAAMQSVERGLKYVPANKALVTLQGHIESLIAVQASTTLTETRTDTPPKTTTPTHEKVFVATEQSTAPSAFVITNTTETHTITDTIQSDGFSNVEDDSENWLTAAELTEDVVEDSIAEQLEEEQRTEHELNHNPEVLQSDVLSNVEDDTDDWLTTTELTEDVVEEQIIEQLAEEEQTEIALNNNPEIIQSDILSNIEDDSGDWQAVTEFAEDVVEDKIVEQLAQEERTETSLTSNPDVLQSDILSITEDDTEDWQTVAELAEDEAITRLLSEVPADTGVILPAQTTEQEHSEQHDTQKPLTDSLLEKITVVGSEIRVDDSVKEIITAQHHVPYLRLIETAKVEGHTGRTLRSHNLRLIPGLEYTPLRIESSRKQQRHKTNVPEPPPFPAIRGSRMQQHMMPSFTFSPPPLPDLESSLRNRLGAIPNAEQQEASRKLSPLEELAARLERARIPAVAEIDETPQPIPPPTTTKSKTEGIVVSETMALIYEKQGALDQAVYAYTQLIAEKPEKAEHFRQKIEEIQLRMEV